MTIKPIYLLPVFLIFLVALAWSNLGSTQRRWEESIKKLEKCEQLASDIGKLEGHNVAQLNVTEKDFDYTSSFQEFANAVEITTKPTASSKVESYAKLNLGRKQFETSLAGIPLKKLIFVVANAPQSEFFISRVVATPTKRLSDEPETWDAEIVWNYYQKD